jgi:hypothetical protein
MYCEKDHLSQGIAVVNQDYQRTLDMGYYRYEGKQNESNAMS